MIKVDEYRLVAVICEGMEKAFRIPVMRNLNCLGYLYEILQENTLKVDDNDLDKLFGVVETCMDRKDEEI